MPATPGFTQSGALSKRFLNALFAVYVIKSLLKVFFANI
jgi:hypothetical protein